MQIKFSPIKGLDEVKTLVKALPRGVKHAFMVAFSEYIVGDERHGLKHEPARVEHGEGNPYEWQTPKQRRWWFATHDGPYVRTHEGVNSWTVTTKDSDWTRVNIEGGNTFVQGDYQQKGHAADGWRKYADIVAANLAGAYNKGLAAVNKILQAVGGLKNK